MAQPIQSEELPLPTSIGVVTDDFDLSTITTADVIFAAGAVIGAILLAQIAKRAIRRVLGDIDGMPESANVVIARIVSYTILTLGVVLALEALGFSFGLVGSVVLLFVIMVALAARPLLQDLGAGLILQIRRPFSPGDQVMIGDARGMVGEVSARTVRIMTVDGARVHLPNRSILEDAIINLTDEGRRLNTFVVGVAYDTDLDRAREVIVDALATVPEVHAEPPPEAFVEEFADSTINIACRFWHAPEIQAEWAARDAAMRATKRAFDETGITIAFPQRVLWTRRAA